MAPGANAAQSLREALVDAHGGRYGHASLKARLVLASEPRNPEAHYVLGMASILAGRARESIEPLAKAALLAPSEPRYAFALGLANDQLGLAQESIDAYRRALAGRPGHFETAANLGNVLQRAGRLVEAIAAYETALRARPDQAQVLDALGLCHLGTGKPEAAKRAFMAAIASEPAFASAHNHLGVVLNRLGHRDEAIGALREAIRLRPDYPEAWFNLGEQHYEAGFHREALAALDRALALAPGNEAAVYLRSAIAGQALEQPPEDYIRSSFDRFAPDYDEKLVTTLRYQTPEKMAAFVSPWLAGRTQTRVVDLGCGTGLSGVTLRPMASELSGVDLSPRMLERARDRRLYDALHEANLVDFLAKQPQSRWDMVVAMDVFVYLGKLDDVFLQATRVLAPGGLFAFSVERLDGAAGFHLQQNSRYAHAPAYLESLARATGLQSWGLSETNIREENGKPVPGLLAAFQKQ